MKKTSNGIGQMIRFGLVGCCNTLVDYGVFYLMIAVANLNKGLSQVVATATAMCVSFLLNRKWTFRKEGKGNMGEIIKFILTNLVSMSVTIVLTHVFHDILHAENWANALCGAVGAPLVLDEDGAVMFAKLLSMVFSVAVNFVGNKFWVFGTKKEEKTV